MFNSIKKVNAVIETPVHVGYRNEKKTILYKDKKTKKIEKHVINSKNPVVGVVQQVKPLRLHHKRRYDLVKKKFGKLESSIIV